MSLSRVAAWSSGLYPIESQAEMRILILSIALLLTNPAYAQDTGGAVDSSLFTRIIHGRDDPSRIDLPEVVLTFLEGQFLTDPPAEMPTEYWVTRHIKVDVGEAAVLLEVLRQEVDAYRAETSAIKAELCSRTLASAQEYADVANAFEETSRAIRTATYDRVLSRVPANVRAEIEALGEELRRSAVTVVIDYDEIIKYYDFHDLASKDCGGQSMFNSGHRTPSF